MLLFFVVFALIYSKIFQTSKYSRHLENVFINYLWKIFIIITLVLVLSENYPCPSGPLIVLYVTHLIRWNPEWIVSHADVSWMSFESVSYWRWLSEDLSLTWLNKNRDGKRATFAFARIEWCNPQNGNVYFLKNLVKVKDKNHRYMLKRLAFCKYSKYSYLLANYAD